MKLLYLSLFAFLPLIAAHTGADEIDTIARLFSHGDIKAIAQQFAPSVDITCPDGTNTYTAAEAETMLGKFFTKNKPLSIKPLHKINSNPNYLMGVFFLATQNGVYRIAVTLNKTQSGMKIIELRLESEKTK